MSINYDISKKLINNDKKIIYWFHKKPTNKRLSPNI